MHSTAKGLAGAVRRGAKGSSHPVTSQIECTPRRQEPAWRR